MNFLVNLIAITYKIICMNIENSSATKKKFLKAFKCALFTSICLFITGLASVPFASQYEPTTANLIYFFGRLPILIAVMYVVISKKE
jgi:hypothetical protein